MDLSSHFIVSTAKPFKSFPFFERLPAIIRPEKVNLGEGGHVIPNRDKLSLDSRNTTQLLNKRPEKIK